MIAASSIIPTSGDAASASRPAVGGHRDPRRGERFEIPVDGADGDLELLGQRRGRRPAARLEEQEERQEAGRSHAPILREKLSGDVRNAV